MSILGSTASRSTPWPTSSNIKPLPTSNCPIADSVTTTGRDKPRPLVGVAQSGRSLQIRNHKRAIRLLFGVADQREKERGSLCLFLFVLCSRLTGFYHIELLANQRQADNRIVCNRHCYWSLVSCPVLVSDSEPISDDLTIESFVTRPCIGRFCVVVEDSRTRLVLCRACDRESFYLVSLNILGWRF